MLLILLAAMGTWLYFWLPGYRKRRALKRLFPAEWTAILRQNIPPFRHLPDGLRQELILHVRHFLYEKEFVGLAGLEINDEIRLTIAGEACLLLLNRKTSGYRALRFIYVYPSGYTAPHQQVDSAGVVTEGQQNRSGESWGNGRVILSWDSVTHGARNFDDGHNVVLHEFAHQLDQESGSANGAPILHSQSSYRSWANVLADEFKDLQRDAQHGKRSLMDHYGATNPAEFFAVATETFYERPEEMAQYQPELFNELKDYYQIDPRRWQ